MVTETTKRIILAHLSVDCNSPDKAIAVVTEKIEESGFAPEVTVAPPGALRQYGAK